MSGKISILITACNEEELLPGALASVAGWADEVVVVVDTKSRDHTAAIVEQAGAQVIEHEFTSSGAQCNWGLAQCRNDWVFILDADERVTEDLRNEINRVILAPPARAFSVVRHNFAFGRRLRFGDWGRDRIIRLVDRRVCRFGERTVHSSVQSPTVACLSGAIEHLTLRSGAQYLPKLHNYARRGAADLVAEGRKSSLIRAVFHGLWRFVRGYLLHLGFLDGGPGLVVAVFNSFGTFSKWVLAWEGMTRPR